MYKLLVSRNDSFSYQFSYNKDGIRAKLETPNDGETIRFAVLMRRFLNPSNVLHYLNIWSILKESFPEAIAADREMSIDSFIKELNKGQVAIKVDQQDITAEDVYHIMANGEFFEKSDLEATAFLQNLAGLPLGTMLLYEFYTYNLGFLHMISLMFDILLEVEKDERYKSFFQEEAIIDKRCIYCLRDTGTFTSEEHIVPESLGNYDTVLAKGVVCDKCNNEVLSGLDAALVDSDLLGLLKTMYMPYTKAGKLPQAEYQDFSIKKVSPTHIVMNDKSTDGSEKFTITSREEDGSISFSISVKGKKEFDPIIIARAMYKIGLGMIAFFEGKNAACQSKYDAARAFICGKQDFPNNLLICNTVKPQPQITTTHDIRWGGTCVHVNIYGIDFLFNLEETPVLNPGEEILKQMNTSLFSLRPLESNPGGS